MSEIIVYLNDYKYAGNGFYETIFLDFRTNDDYEGFVRELNLARTTGSFLQINGYHSQKRLIPDSYYALNIEMLKHLQPAMDQESLLIGYKYDFTNYKDDNTIAFNLLKSHDALDPSELYSAHHQPLTDIGFQGQQFSNTELWVNNVGQANWNEIRQDGIVRIVYDIGAPTNASRSQVRWYINQFFAQYQNDQPDLVLSHWDQDHYHCLLEMTDTELACFSRFICVDGMKSKTPKELYNRMERVLGINKIFCIAPVARTPPSRYPTMHEKFSKIGFGLYAGEASRNRNYSGLVLYAQGNVAHALLTGDSLLCQVDDVFQLLHRQGKLKNCHHIRNDHYLVVPHHGGDIRPSYKSYHVPACINAKEAICSVDENDSLAKLYNHPSTKMRDFLKGVANWAIVRTDKELQPIHRPL